MLTIENGEFRMNGEKFHIYSGAIHYFRTLPEYWEDRLLKLKRAGFNTVETYVSWNLHEPKPGEFDFSGMLDIVRFLETAKKVGLYAIVRPGPYICAEWDFGGFPAWLLKDKNMQLRCCYPDYLDCVKRFYEELLRRITPMQITNGGNVIAMQVENEYGSYANDKTYLRFIEKLMRDCGVDVLLFTSDGNWKNMLSGGSLPDIYKVLNFGSGAKHAFKALKGFQEDAPKMCGEFWCGWFDHWGEKHHTRKSDSVVKEIKDFLDIDASFNFYMFHGGTNFGFTAGANHGKGYEPTVTSYDYCALLNEWGDYTPAYHAVRKLMHEAQGLEPEPLPPCPALQTIGEVQLTEFAGLFDNLDTVGGKHTAPVPEGMEHFGQNFGLIYYETELKGKYQGVPLRIDNVHDFAYVYLNGKLKKRISRMPLGKKFRLFKKAGADNSLMLPGFNGSTKIGVLVDTMGRVNYGEHIYDRKGITDIFAGAQRLMEYNVYTLPLDNLEKLAYKREAAECPAFLKGAFKATSQADCFVHVDGFKKGYIFVNGFNLGRYWEVGPQKSLYLPGVLLKEENEIVILEMEGFDKPIVSITNQHDLG